MTRVVATYWVVILGLPLRGDRLVPIVRCFVPHHLSLCIFIFFGMGTGFLTFLLPFVPLPRNSRLGCSGRCLLAGLRPSPCDRSAIANPGPRPPSRSARRRGR